MLLFLHFMLDVVNVLTKVSLVFQQKEAAVCHTFNEVEAAKAILSTYRERDGPKLSLMNVPDLETFDGQKLTGEVKRFLAARSKVIDSLLENLGKRFKAKSEVISATAIAVLRNFPTKLAQQPDFGDKQVETLCRIWRSPGCS